MDKVKAVWDRKYETITMINHMFSIIQNPDFIDEVDIDGLAEVYLEVKSKIENDYRCIRKVLLELEDESVYMGHQ